MNKTRYSYAYPDPMMRNRLSSALGARVPRGGLDPIYYAFAGIPISGAYPQWGRGGFGGPGGAGGGGTNPPGGGTTNPPAGGGGTTNPPAQTPWQYPNLLQSPLPFSLGPDWRRTMLYAGMTPPNP